MVIQCLAIIATVHVVVVDRSESYQQDRPVDKLPRSLSIAQDSLSNRLG
jgi:hypothetical protein